MNIQDLHQFYHDLLQPSEQLRSISNTGEVNVQPSSCHACSRCRKPIQAQQPQQDGSCFLTCRLCQSAVYCSVACQSAHWNSNKGGGHRHCCPKIRRCRKTVMELSTEYRISNGIMDVFDRDNGIVFWFASSPQGLGSIGNNYMQQRLDLVRAYLEEAALSMPFHWETFALELALEHCIDLLHLDPVQADSSVRTTVAHCLLVLERYQDLYEFVKYWNVLPQKLRAIQRANPALTFRQSELMGQTLEFALGPSTFWNFKERQQFVFEDQSQLALRPPCASNLVEIKTFPPPTEQEVITMLYLALAKLKIHETILGVETVLSNRLSIESDIVVSKVAQFVGVQPSWLTVDAETIQQQVYELLVFANDSVPNILARLMECPSVPFQAGSHSRDRIPLLELLKAAWASSTKAWDFLETFSLQQQKGDSNCSKDSIVRRHQMLQSMFDQVYQHYLEQDKEDRDRVQQHWNRVQDSPQVRQLMLDQSQWFPSPAQPFSIGRIVAAMQQANQHSVADLVLEDLYELADDEAFLAGEHLMQVRNQPNVQEFLQCYGLDKEVLLVPLQCNSIRETYELTLRVTKQLMLHGLASRSNLKLLFGNEGWVAPLTTNAVRIGTIWTPSGPEVIQYQP